MPDTTERKTPINALGAAIERALGEAPVADVLSVLTGAFISLTVEVVRRHGHDVQQDIKVNGGPRRDITIHAPKPAGEAQRTEEQASSGAPPADTSTATVLGALRDALSVCTSVTTSRHRLVVTEGCKLYAQTAEWCEWLEQEVAPKVEAAIQLIEGKSPLQAMKPMPSQPATTVAA